MMDRDRREKIWAERAKQLKKVPKQVQPEGRKKVVVVFLLENNMFALESEFVHQVLKLSEYSELPCTPDYILGIINVESRILAVVDMRKLLKLPNQGITNLNRVILLRDREIEFGVVVDEILGREEIDLADFNQIGRNAIDRSSDLVQGVSRAGIKLLNTEELMRDKRLIINEEV